MKAAGIGMCDERHELKGKRKKGVLDGRMTQGEALHGGISKQRDSWSVFLTGLNFDDWCGCGIFSLLLCFYLLFAASCFPHRQRKEMWIFFYIIYKIFVWD